MAPTRSKATPKLDFNVTFYEKDHKQSPYLEEAIKRCVAVCEEYDLKHYSKEFSEFCAYTFPLLPEEPFYLANELIMYHWQLDDMFDDANYDIEKKWKYLTSLYLVLKFNTTDPNIPQTALYKQLINRIKSDCLRDILKDEFQKYSDAVRKVVTVLPEVLDIEEYMKLRKDDCACFYTWLLIFFDKDDFEPYKIFIDSEKGQRAWDLARNNACYVNDVVSLNVDKKNGSNYNIVIIWMKKYEKSKEEAIGDILDMARECMREILTIKNDKTITDDEIGNEVLEKLILWLQGHNIWAINAPRYKVRA